MISSKGPLVVGFDDGSSLEITFGSMSEAFISRGYSDERQPNLEVDASRVLRQIIGEKVSAVEVIAAPESSWERECAEEEECGDPFKYVLIKCEDHMLYLSRTCTCAVMPNGAKLAPLSMAMQELKDSISYYDELFD